MKRFNSSSILIALLILFNIGTFLFFNRKLSNSAVETSISQIDGNKAKVLHQDKSLSELKKENRNLYDSIKNVKSNLESATEIRYKYKYVTDTIFVDNTKIHQDSVYTFEENKNNIKTEVEVKASDVKWVRVKSEIVDTLQIYNLKYGKNNVTNITSSNNNLEIQQVTSFKRKTKFMDRFVIGPTVSVGFSPITKSFDTHIGVGITYKLY